MKTKTLFRTFHTGDTIALFPEIPADVRGHHCASYQAIGQHGAASPDLSHCTRPATPDEIAPLRAELERIGYTVAPVRRVSYAMHRARRAAAAPVPVPLIGDPGHAEAQAETVRRLTTRPAWKLTDCTRTA
jgi:hypothetical protein